MKKTLAIALSLMLAAGVFASCGKNKNEDVKTPGTDIENAAGDTTENSAESNENESTEGVDTSAFTTQGIIDSIYAQKAPLFMYGSIPVDMTDKDSYMTYLGVEDISKIKEATVSESMMGAQAYSLVVARVADGVDAKAVAEEMKAGINPRKWICVEADDVKVTTAGDLICFCMISTEYKEAMTADDAINAFTKVVNGEAEYIEVSEEALPEEEITDEEIVDEIPETDVEDVVIPENGNTETAPNDSKAEEPVLPEDNTSGDKAETVPEEEQSPAVNEEENVPAETPEVLPEEVLPEEALPEEVLPEEEVIPEEVPEGTDANTEIVGATGLEAIINDMYAIKAPQFMFGTMPVDLTDEFSYGTYLGIKDPSKVVEAVVSEPMIGAQAYSLVIARVAPGQDAAAVAAEMQAGIDPRKWVCVEADDVKVTTKGDLICFCMISTDFAEDYTAEDAMNAFKSVVK